MVGQGWRAAVGQGCRAAVSQGWGALLGPGWRAAVGQGWQAAVGQVWRAAVGCLSPGELLFWPQGTLAAAAEAPDGMPALHAWVEESQSICNTYDQSSDNAITAQLINAQLALADMYTYKHCQGDVLIVRIPQICPEVAPSHANSTRWLPLTTGSSEELVKNTVRPDQGKTTLSG